MISRRQEFCSQSFEHLQVFSSTDCADNFLNFPKSRITRVISADNFLDAPLAMRQTIYFSNFSHADNFFPIRMPPGKTMVSPKINGKNVKFIRIKDLRAARPLEIRPKTLPQGTGISQFLKISPQGDCLELTDA